MSGLVKRLHSSLTIGSEPSNEGVKQLPYDNPTDSLMTLIDEFQRVDLTSLTAKLNETTITDNNGGRIEL